jgi:hypothetical protein
VVALAPADRNTATELRVVERQVEDRTGATVYAPTARLWPHEQPANTAWSFDREQRVAVPAFQRRLDEGERTAAEQGEPTETTGGHESAPDGDDASPSGAERLQRAPGDGEFVNVDVQYAYSVLRLDDERAVSFRPGQREVAKLATSERHVTERVDCAVVKLSPDLSAGENSLFLVGDGSQQIDHFAVLTEPSPLNRTLVETDYGDPLYVENTLVLWNDDEGAYNLVVDGETIVEPIPG